MKKRIRMSNSIEIFLYVPLITHEPNSSHPTNDEPPFLLSRNLFLRMSLDLSEAKHSHGYEELQLDVFNTRIIQIRSEHAPGFSLSHKSLSLRKRPPITENDCRLSFFTVISIQIHKK
jgi:hypothetical protein